LNNKVTFSLFLCARHGPILTSLQAGSKIKVISRELIVTSQTSIFAYYFTTNTTEHCFYTVFGVAIYTVNSLEIMIILQSARYSDVKIGLDRAQHCT